MFKRLKHRFMRSMTGKPRLQLLWLGGIIGVVLLLWITVGLCCAAFHGNLRCDSLCAFFGDVSSVIRGVISIFIDPGSAWNFDIFTGETVSGGDAHSPSILSLVVAMSGLVLFIGVLVTALTNLLDRAKDRFRNGKMEFRHKGHVVIIGFSDVVPMLVHELCTTDAYAGCDILIQSAIYTHTVRNKVFSELKLEQEKRVFFLAAKRDSVEELQKLQIEHAQEVFVIGDSDEDYHDSLNLDCLEKIIGILRNKRKHGMVKAAIPFNVFFNNQNTFSSFQTTDIKPEWKDYIDFRAYNFCNEWARLLLVKRKWKVNSDRQIRYPALDHKLITSSSQSHVHLVIVGMNNMGTALGVMAAHMMHFPNFFDREGREQPQHSTIVTFIDDHADTEMQFFRGHYTGYFDISACTYRDFIHGDGTPQVVPPTSKEAGEDFLDVKFEFINGRIESDGVRSMIDEWVERKDEELSIAVCLSDASKSLGAGLYLPESVYRQRIPVFIRQASSSALLAQLGCGHEPADSYHKYKEVYPFGMLDRWFDLSATKLEQAKKISSLYDYYGQKKALPTAEELGKKANDDWCKLSVPFQWSNLYAAYSIGVKLRAFGQSEDDVHLSEEEVQRMAMMEHARWNMEKLMMGYRRPTKAEMDDIVQNGRKKWYQARFIHVYIAPYNALSDGVKAYDVNIAQSIGEIIRLSKLS